MVSSFGRRIIFRIILAIVLEKTVTKCFYQSIRIEVTLLDSKIHYSHNGFFRNKAFVKVTCFPLR